MINCTDSCQRICIDVEMAEIEVLYPKGPNAEYISSTCSSVDFFYCCRFYFYKNMNINKCSCFYMNINKCIWCDINKLTSQVRIKLFLSNYFRTLILYFTAAETSVFKFYFYLRAFRDDKKDVSFYFLLYSTE